MGYIYNRLIYANLVYFKFNLGKILKERDENKTKNILRILFKSIKKNIDEYEYIGIYSLSIYSILF